MKNVYTNLKKHTLKVSIMYIVYGNVIYTLLKIFCHHLKLEIKQSCNIHSFYRFGIIISNKYIIKVEATRKNNTLN